jgi:hypothetical protein
MRTAQRHERPAKQATERRNPWSFASGPFFGNRPWF